MRSPRYMYLAAIASIAIGIAWSAFAETEKTDNNPPVLFVQTAPGASFRDGKLMLMSPSTIFFSERPEKIAGHMPCHNFIKAWSAGDDSFAKTPPNAALTVFVPNGRPEKMIVTLKNPRFDGPNLIYDADLIKGKIPGGMSEAALFIDDARLQNVYYQDVLPNGTVTGPIAPDAQGGG
ncbi:MAG: hypothetical protein WBX25_29530 [Rhodomicrobium sp.]